MSKSLFKRSSKSVDTVDMNEAFSRIVESAYVTTGYQSMIDEIKSEDITTPAIPLMKNMCLENYGHDMGNGLYFNTKCQYDEHNNVTAIELVDRTRDCVVGKMELTDEQHEILNNAIVTSAASELCENHVRPNSVTLKGRDGIDPLDPKYAEIMQANAAILKKSPVIKSVAIQAKDDNVILEHGYSVDESTASDKSRESHIVTPNGSVFIVSKDGNTTGINRIIKKNGSEINLDMVGQLNKQYGNTGADKSAVISGACADWLNKTDNNVQKGSAQLQL